MSLEAPTAWDQSAWAIAVSAMGLVASVVAAMLAGGAKRAAREQRTGIRRARLLTAMERCRAVVVTAQGDLDASPEPDLAAAVRAMGEWNVVAGEVRGHLLEGCGLPADDQARLRRGLDVVAQERSLLLVYLDVGASADLSGLRRALRELDRLLNELRITMELGADT
jgi:hypothetical protein